MKTTHLTALEGKDVKMSCRKKMTGQQSSSEAELSKEKNDQARTFLAFQRQKPTGK